MVVRFPRDTTDEAIQVEREALRRLGLEGRAAITFQLGNSLRSVIESGIRLQHPQWDECQIRVALAGQDLGSELARQVGAKLGKGAGMSQDAFFETIRATLRNAGIPFMFSGEIASMREGN